MSTVCMCAYVRACVCACVISIFYNRYSQMYSSSGKILIKCQLSMPHSWKQSERHVFCFQFFSELLSVFSELDHLLASSSASKFQPITAVPGYVNVSLKSESFTSVSPALVQHQTMTMFLAMMILGFACKYCFNEVYIIEVFGDKNLSLFLK